MASTLQLILCLGMLALCLANPVNNIRWCVKSDAELKKCRDVSQTCGSDQTTVSCVLRANNDECCKAISDDLADAIALDSGEIYKCSLHPYNLKPVIAENYGTEKDPDTCYFSVALVKESSTFMFKDLRGKKFCHTGVGRAAGWTSPVGTFLVKQLFKWDGPETQSLEKAFAAFVSAACAPGAKEPNLCKLCAGKDDKKCKASENEPYYGYAGARLCLKDKGDVAFVKHLLPDEFHKGYMLLCLDNTRKPVEEYEKCFWARIPAHAVVTADRAEKVKSITQFLEEAQKKAECKLFSSPHGKDLMFKDSATSLITLPEKMDSFLYLGPSFTNANKALYNELETPSEETIRWCTQSVEEKKKCDRWSIASEGSIECIEASSADECITKVLKGEADAVSLDGGYLYTAGACGLVPAIQEIYDAELCKNKRENKKGTYKAVAVVKKSNKAITWKNLRGFKSCHTGLGRTAGYNIPAGLIHKQTGVCDLGTFFTESCVPGADPNSNLCKLCGGNDKTKCLPNNREPYYGYDGALRCLIKAGDVCFVKQSTVDENIENVNSPAWAKGVKKDDLELLCPDGTRRPVSDYENCYLALVPAHAVATTADRKETVVRILTEQMGKFGKNAGQGAQFQMFVSEGRKDQLFKDSTQCLTEVQEKTMNDYLGKDYADAIASLNECGESGLLAACTFHTCKLQ
ncbi:PREDICTED: serotransferrin-A-like [Nanorana parkeri]|uniref:serotransferrin-A-like n=1 Tax=Nanorana parkeri TaxID=125878 RepID=UPI00085501B2|nr:PREDICTED: serotransferrin-A-like [Nanorana parkeri]